MDLFPKDKVEFILKDRDTESALIKKRFLLSGLLIYDFCMKSNILAEYESLGKTFLASVAIHSICSFVFSS